jgi:hypothetical protein
MSIAQVSANSVTANPAYLNPQVKAEQAASVPQVNQDATRTTQSLKTDTVTISQQALQKLANEGKDAGPKTGENGSQQYSGKAPENK